MRTVRTVSDLRSALAADRREGRSIGLVPTMGALHEGHLSLVARAREECERVVVSLFVNPSQFNESADLARYPRREREDAELAHAAGADLLFAPSVPEVYPAAFATSVQVGSITDRLEGAGRGAAHFHGVTTVVAKLLGMAMPDAAYFGQKDYQQVLVIRRMVEDLNIPVRVVALPTVRDRDGLALSSRNSLLDPEGRERALALHTALERARGAAQAGEQGAAALLEAARGPLAAARVEAEYVALVDAATLEPVHELTGEALLAIAARVDGVRLIDNTILAPPPTERPTPHPQGDMIATCNA